MEYPMGYYYKGNIMSEVMIKEWLAKNVAKKCPPVRNGSDTKAIKTDTSRVTKVSMPTYGLAKKPLLAEDKKAPKYKKQRVYLLSFFKG